MAWIDRFFVGGYAQIQIAGVPVAGEVALNFTAGAAGVDDPGNKRTNLSIGGSTTAWAAFTPTITDGTNPIVVGSGGASSAVWRQTGTDTIEVQWCVSCGAAGLNLGSGALRFGLPSGWQIDITKYAGPVTIAQGSVYLADASTPANNRGGRVDVASGHTYVQVTPHATASQLSATVPFTFAVNDSINVAATIPVVAV